MLSILRYHPKNSAASLQPRFGHRGRRVPKTTSGCCSIVQSLNIRLPLRNIDSLDPAVVREQAVDLTLDIGCLGPNATAAREKLNLLSELFEENAGAVVEGVKVQIDLVGTVDSVDRLFDIPEAEKNSQIHGSPGPKFGSLAG